MEHAKVGPGPILCCLSVLFTFNALSQDRLGSNNVLLHYMPGQRRLEVTTFHFSDASSVVTVFLSWCILGVCILFNPQMVTTVRGYSDNNGHYTPVIHCACLVLCHSAPPNPPLTGSGQTSSLSRTEPSACNVDEAASSKSDIAQTLPPFSPDLVRKLQSLFKSVQTATAKESLVYSLRWISSLITHPTSIIVNCFPFPFRCRLLSQIALEQGFSKVKSLL